MSRTEPISEELADKTRAALTELGFDFDEAEEMIAKANSMRAGEWPVGEFEMPLRASVVVADETITHLTLREPTEAEWQDIFAKPVAQRRRYAVSVIAGLPQATVAKIGIGDVVRAENYLNAFFEVGQAIAGW